MCAFVNNKPFNSNGGNLKMKKSNVRSALLSAFAGAMLALAVLFSGSASIPRVQAEPPGGDNDYWCPNPPPGCNFWACQSMPNDRKLCKFVAYTNGVNCSSEMNCIRKPPGGEGGGILIE
jgi:hypothetical protein